MIYFSSLVHNAKYGLQIAHLLTGTIGITALDLPFNVLQLTHHWHEPIFVLYAAITVIDYINPWLSGRKK